MPDKLSVFGTPSTPVHCKYTMSRFLMYNRDNKNHKEGRYVTSVLKKMMNDKILLQALLNSAPRFSETTKDNSTLNVVSKQKLT